MSMFSNLINRFSTPSGSLIISIFVLVVLVFTAYPWGTPSEVKLVAQKKITLDVGDLSNGELIMPGDTVTILGQIIDRPSSSVLFWVTTEDGERGYIRQEDLDNKAIVYNLKKADSTRLISEGDTVIILSRSNESHEKFKIRTKDGKNYELDHDQVLSLTGMELLDYELNKNSGYYLSKKKFERLYIGKTFEETEELPRKAFFVKRSGNNIDAEYELSIFDPEDGIRYKPTIKFENNIAVSYTLKESNKSNRLVLRYLPLAGKIIDIGLFSTLISGNIYDFDTLEDESYPIWMIILVIIASPIALAAFLGWLFFTNHIISLFLCGLLHFRYPLYFLSNKAAYYIFFTISILSTYIWIVLVLCYPFPWLIFIPISVYVTLKVIKNFHYLLMEYPSSRCPKCKSIETIYYNRIEIIKEYQEWRNETEKGRLLSSQTNKWQTWTDVETTTKNSHGQQVSVKHHKENVKNHQETIDTFEYNQYKILYLVRDCRKIYICKKCGYEEHCYVEELEELNRNHVNSYAKSI